MNCWEFKKCSDETYRTCPAYPDRGLDCWKVTGTKCEMGKYIKATAAEKISYCRSCDFYSRFAHKF